MPPFSHIQACFANYRRNSGFKKKSCEKNAKLNNHSIENDIDKSFKVLSKSYFDIKYKNKRDLDINKNDDLEVPSSKYNNYWKDKTFITTFYLYILLYARFKYINLMQMVMGYYIFAQNMHKHYIKIFHQLGLFVSSKTSIRQSL